MKTEIIPNMKRYSRVLVITAKMKFKIQDSKFRVNMKTQMAFNLEFKILNIESVLSLEKIQRSRKQLDAYFFWTFRLDEFIIRMK